MLSEQVSGCKTVRTGQRRLDSCAQSTAIVRLTVDLDLVVDLRPQEAMKAVETLTAHGFRPRIPEPPASFADPARRRAWVTERNLSCFRCSTRQNPSREVDLFVEEPIPFEDLWACPVTRQLGATLVRVAALEDLIHMKQRAGRAKDLDDIALPEGDRTQ